MDALDGEVEVVAEWVAAAERIVVLTGAGISTDSGIPDFRGPNGVWTKNPAAEKMATIQHYLADPDVRGARRGAAATRTRRSRLPPTAVTWRSSSWPAVASCTPSSPRTSTGCTRRPGSPRSWWSRSTARSGGPAAGSARTGARWPRRWPASTPARRIRRARCAAGSSRATRSRSVRRWCPRSSTRRCRSARSADLLLAIGSTLSVYPAANCVPRAKRAGARVVIVNASPTEMDGIADSVLQGPIGTILPRLVAGP